MMQGSSSSTTIQHGFEILTDHAWHTRKGSGAQTAAAAGSSAPGFKGLLEISNADMLPSTSVSPVMLASLMQQDWLLCSERCRPHTAPKVNQDFWSCRREQRLKLLELHIPQLASSDWSRLSSGD